MATSKYFGAKARGRIGDKIYSVQNSEQRIQAVPQQWNDGCTFEQAQSRLINLSCSKAYKALKLISQDTFGCKGNKRLNFGKFMAINYDNVLKNYSKWSMTVSCPTSGTRATDYGMYLGGYIVSDGPLTSFPLLDEMELIPGYIFYKTGHSVQDYEAGATYIDFQQIKQLFYGRTPKSNWTILMGYKSGASTDDACRMVAASFGVSSQWDGDISASVLRKLPLQDKNIYEIINDRNVPLRTLSDRRPLFYVDDDGGISIGIDFTEEDTEIPSIGVIHWVVQSNYMICSRTYLHEDYGDPTRNVQKYNQDLRLMHDYMHRKRVVKEADTPSDL